ncbi:hypothetical protein NIES3275_06950 [Microchaete diplosiphon NIES-3275]|nr:hypothetical protein NIES3275_06950 [Microchaete diplosiphon NIES-3275]
MTAVASSRETRPTHCLPHAPCPMPIFNTGLKLVERVELSLTVLTLLVYRVRTGVIGDQLCDV